MAGRKRQSVEALKKKGKSHLTKAEIQKREEEEEKLKKLPKDKIKPPTWLHKKAKKIFKDVVNNLDAIDILANVDIYKIAMFSDNMNKYILVNQQMEDENGDFQLTVSYTNKAGATNEVQNPKFLISCKLADLIRKQGAELGLSPASRLKLIADNSKGDIDEFEKDFG